MCLHKIYHTRAQWLICLWVCVSFLREILVQNSCEIVILVQNSCESVHRVQPVPSPRNLQVVPRQLPFCRLQTSQLVQLFFQNYFVMKPG